MAHLLSAEHTVIIDIEEVETEKSVAGDDAGDVQTGRNGLGLKAEQLIRD